MDELMSKINQFHEERDWRQYHNEKDLAISISLEAAELLELFQWISPEEAIEQSSDDLKDELADVLIYSLMLADNLDVDIKEIIKNKLKKNALKYPIAKSKGSNKKYDQL